MPVKTSFVTEDFMRKIPLPNHGGRYAVVPHAFVIDETRKQLSAAGFVVDRELYKTSLDGQMAQGIYHLKYGNDKDMGLMFAWSNSYNKMMRFKCAVGAQVFICMNGVVRGDLGNYKRKHIGTQALTDVTNSIQSQISQAANLYDMLVQDKEMLKNVILTPSQKGRILGELFAAEEILTLTQVGIVKREMDKPTYNYNCDKDSAWALYNHVTLALKESHPLHFLNDHEVVHNYFINEFGQLVTPGFQPEENDPVEEVPQETTSDLDVVYPDMGVNFL